MERFNIESILITHLPNIYYLSGFSGTSGFLCLTLNKARLYTDFRYLQQAAEEAPFFEIIKVGSSEDFAEISSFLVKSKIKNLALEETHLTVRKYNRFQTSALGIELIPQFQFVEEIRAIKEEAEVEKITTAAKIADQAFQQVLPLIKPGMREEEVALELEYRLRKGGSQKNPFDIIVASGPRSALPHGLASSRIIGEGELITIDFGAVFNGYSSDMTRTFVLGEPSQKQRDIYKMVFEAQKLALADIRKGNHCAAIDGAVREYFQKKGCASYFGHGLGHGVGLEVHELPILSPKSNWSLEEGMVFTVEPGLYLEGWGGVRIEDMVVLRSDGPEVLTSSPKVLAIK